MSYIGKNLSSGEEVVHRTKLSKIVFLWPTLWTAGGIALFLNEYMFGLLLILLGIGLGIGTLAQYLTSEFAITNKRVVLKTGLIRRQAVETLLQKVEGMGVDQSILGRIMNYGTVVFSGTGGSSDGFEYVSAPLSFRKKLMEEIEKYTAKG